MRPFISITLKPDFVDERISQITHLPENADQLLSRFDNPRPRNIRRAVKEGVKIIKNNQDGINFLYSTHLANINGIGGLPKKYEFFESIPSKMEQNQWAIFTAFLER